MQRTDKDSGLVVYGIRCVWWDGIENTGRIEPTPQNKLNPRFGGLPCCPHCKSVLMQMDIADWWKGVEKHEANGHAGYRAFIEWMKGKCFPTMAAAKAAYEADGKRTVTL